VTGFHTSRVTKEKPNVLRAGQEPAFRAWEQRIARAPLIPLAIFRRRPLVAANLVILLLYAALFSTFFFTAIGMYAVAPQVVAYLIDAGFPPLQAATAWGFSGVVLLFGMLSVSWLDGVIGRRPSVLFSYAMSVVGIFLLWLLQWYPNIWVLTGFVVCFGSMIGSRGPLLTATAMKLFRGKRVGTIYGSISIGSGLGSAFGSWSGGLIHDVTHSYNPLLLYALIAVVLGMIPFLVVPALRQ